MARYNVTLPETVVKKLAEEAKRQDVALSTLIAKYIEQYYKGKSEANVEAELQQSRRESRNTTQRERNEREKRAQEPVAEREGRLQQVRADDGKATSADAQTMPPSSSSVRHRNSQK